MRFFIVRSSGLRDTSTGKEMTNPAYPLCQYCMEQKHLDLDNVGNECLASDSYNLDPHRLPHEPKPDTTSRFTRYRPRRLSCHTSPNPSPHAALSRPGTLSEDDGQCS